MSECELSNLIAELEKAVSAELDRVDRLYDGDHDDAVAKTGAAFALDAMLSAIRSARSALKAREAGQ